MIKKITAVVLAILFFGIAVIHFYWASGGMWGLTNALPTTEDGMALFNPTTVDCITVGLAFLVLGLFYIRSHALPKRQFWIRIQRIVLWGIPILFMVRAIGDFKYVGFFKEIDATNFAYYDTFFYSPLCLLITILGFLQLKRTS